MKGSLQSPKRWRESPRAFRLKDHPSAVIFRDRFLRRETRRREALVPGPARPGAVRCGATRRGRHAVEAKKGERKRKARRERRLVDWAQQWPAVVATTPSQANPGQTGQSRAEPSREARPNEQESPESGDCPRSVSLASVSAWLRPTFLHLAGERPLRFFVPRLNVFLSSTRRPLDASRKSC